MTWKFYDLVFVVILQVEKVKQELAAAQSLLQSTREDHRQIRDENQGLRLRLGEGDSGQEQMLQEYQKLSVSVNRLQTERKELEQECLVR